MPRPQRDKTLEQRVRRLEKLVRDLLQLSTMVAAPFLDEERLRGYEARKPAKRKRAKR